MTTDSNNPISPLLTLKHSDSTSRIRSIDGLRGLAILLVVVFHTYARWPGYIPWVTTNKDLFIFKYGYLGVELFFLISGYVIYMTLEKCESFNEFIFRRWLRLFPAMLLATILIYTTSFFLTERPSGSIRLIDTIPGLFFVQGEIFNKLQQYTVVKVMEGAFWSLFVEVKFYLVFGAIYFYKKDKALRNLIVVFLVSFTYMAFRKIFPALSVGRINEVFFFYLSLQYFGWFCVGALLYKAISAKARSFNYASALLMIPTVLMLPPREDTNAVMASFACLLIYLIFNLALYSKYVSSVFGSNMLVLIGFFSYPLYLIHENALVALTIKTHASLTFLPDFMSPWPGIIAIATCSYVIAKYLEPKIKTFLRRHIPRVTHKFISTQRVI